MFERISWHEDRLLLDDLVFYLDQERSTPADSTPDGFFLHKPRRLLDQYVALWRQRPGTTHANMLELGIFDGGSVAFWFELLKPDKYVALDNTRRDDVVRLDEFIASRGLGDRIKTFYDTDQSDCEALRRIVDTEFDGPLDLIIDDASHWYTQTRASFETLFPLLRPGGLFIIEDWSWACWPNLPPGFARAGTELPRLIHQIVDVAGSMERFLVGDPGNPGRMNLQPLIASVTTYPDLVVVERGDAPVGDVSDFDLDKYATFRPTPAPVERWLAGIRRKMK